MTRLPTDRERRERAVAIVLAACLIAAVGLLISIFFSTQSGCRLVYGPAACSTEPLLEREIS